MYSICQFVRFLPVGQEFGKAALIPTELLGYISMIVDLLKDFARIVLQKKIKRGNLCLLCSSIIISISVSSLPNKQWLTT